MTRVTAMRCKFNFRPAVNGVGRVTSEILQRARSPIAALASIAAPLYLTVACSAPDTPASNAEPRTWDSAGITIVMGGDPAMSDVPTWSIDTIPAVEIGSTDGDAPYLFSYPVWSTRQSDGRFVIGDWKSAEIRIFDSAGKYQETIGRQGSGPGEYKNFSGFHRYRHDSLLVLDYEGLRARIIAPDGRESRRFSPRIADHDGHRYSTPKLIGIFNDGTLLVGDRTDACSWDLPPTAYGGLNRRAPPGYCEDSISLYQLGQNGKVLRNYGDFLLSRELSANTSTGKRVNIPGITPRVMLRQRGDRFFYSDGATPEVHIYHRERGLTHIIRVPNTRVAQTPKLPPRHSAASVKAGAPGPSHQAEVEDAFASIDHPKIVRYFNAMQIDLEGNVWLEDSEEEPSPIFYHGSVRWFIFDSTGVLKARLIASRRIMPGASPEIGSDYILIHSANRDAVPIVQSYRIRKNER